jgi:hypothetical protein
MLRIFLLSTIGLVPNVRTFIMSVHISVVVFECQPEKEGASVRPPEHGLLPGMMPPAPVDERRDYGLTAVHRPIVLKRWDVRTEMRGGAQCNAGISLRSEMPLTQACACCPCSTTFADGIDQRGRYWMKRRAAAPACQDKSVADATQDCGF